MVNNSTYTTKNGSTRSSIRVFSFHAQIAQTSEPMEATETFTVRNRINGELRNIRTLDQSHLCTIDDYRCKNKRTQWKGKCFCAPWWGSRFSIVLINFMIRVWFQRVTSTTFPRMQISHVDYNIQCTERVILSLVRLCTFRNFGAYTSYFTSKTSHAKHDGIYDCLNL